jgi:hypothetical protein
MLGTDYRVVGAHFSTGRGGACRKEINNSRMFFYITSTGRDPMCYKTSLEPGDFLATQSNVTRGNVQDVVIQVLTHSASIFDCKSCGNSRSVFRGLGRGLSEVSAWELVCNRSDQVDLNTEGSILEDWILLGKACLKNLGLESSGESMSGKSCRENQVWTMSGRNRYGEIRVEIRLARNKLEKDKGTTVCKSFTQVGSGEVCGVRLTYRSFRENFQEELVWKPEGAVATELACKQRDQVDLSLEGSTFVGGICLGKVCQNNPGLGMSGEIMPGKSCLVNIVLNMPGKSCLQKLGLKCWWPGLT